MNLPHREAKMALQPIGDAMALTDVFATILAIAYFAATIIGFQSELLSETQTKLLVVAGIICTIVLSLMRRQPKL